MSGSNNVLKASEFSVHFQSFLKYFLDISFFNYLIFAKLLRKIFLIIELQSFHFILDDKAGEELLDDPSV